jgi:cytochrome c peroxidase
MRRALVLVVLALAGCGGPVPAPWVWRLPPGFPEPKVPDDNPMSEDKVQLGRRLFYDRRLSRNGEQACASCHQQARAFTDGRPVAVGSTGEHHRRNALGLANVAYASSLTWGNPLITTLERQALLPLLGETPVELGWAGHEDELFARLASDADYAKRFAAAFPEEKGAIHLGTITRALAAFERTLLSTDAPYDRWVRGDAAALSDAAKRGMDLFNSERLECYHCHAGFTFSDSVSHAGTQLPETIFHNTGLYDVDRQGSYPLSDQGVFEVTGRAQDMGRFRAPTLRNVTLTAPYMHDGSIATLSDVVDTYAAGGRAKQLNGQPSPLQSDLVRGFTLTADEKADLMAFLESLTDTSFVQDARHADPFAPAP